MSASHVRNLLTLLLVLVAVWPCQPVAAAVTPCGGRQQLVFVNGGDSITQHAVAAIACATSAIRQLQPRKPVSVRLLAADSLRAAIAQTAQTDLAAQSLDGTVTALRLFGALTPNEDLAAISRSQYSPTSAADYDMSSQTLYVRLARGGFSPLDRAVIAHEYTHALQDQYFGLAGLLADPQRSTGHNSDALLAREAVVEGDAFTTMLAYASTFSRQDQVTFNQQLQRSTSTVTDFAHDRIGFPAEQGTVFVKQLVSVAEKGKTGSAALAAAATALNQALSNPPDTTQVILNPSLYQARMAPASHPLPTLTLDRAWQQVNSDVLGSFSIADLLSQHPVPAGTAQAAAQAAAAWQSDRWAVYQKGSQSMLVWRGRFSAAAGAQAFWRAFVSYTATRFHTALNGTTSLDWHTSGYAMSLRLNGVRVSLVMASSPDLQADCQKVVAQLASA